MGVDAITFMEITAHLPSPFCRKANNF